MKVLMAQDTFLPKIGGAEVHVSKLSETMQGRGHQVTVVTATEGAPLVNGLQVHRFPLLKRQGKLAVAVMPIYLPSLVQLVLQHDIVHGHYTAICSAILGMLSRVLHRPFVVTLHGYGTLDSSVRNSTWLSLWRRLALTSADRVIATSEEMADVARRFIPDGRILTIPNGIDTKTFRSSRNDLYSSSVIKIGAVRRLVPKNGVQYLIEAAPLIIHNSPKPVEFWIVGDGSLRPYLEARAKFLGVDNVVRFIGTMPNEQVPQILDEIHIAVFPSSAESTSIAALEAMSMGKPIVASSVGGYPFLLGQNERGLLVKLFDRCASDYDAPLTLPPDRINLFADAVLRLIREPNLALRTGENARKYVRQHFDWSEIASRVERIYFEVTNR